MQKVINRKLYNTETATLIASWSNDSEAGDPHYCHEELYKTMRGNFFLYGEGGAQTHWGNTNGKIIWEGDGIDPIDQEEAEQWINDHHICLDDPYHVFHEIEEA